MVARNLPRCRIEAGLSPLGLARAARVDPRTVYRLERGQSSSQFPTLRVLADALNVEVRDLVKDRWSSS
jgi:transcriptional regulator with XRE-family HTH domain